MDYKKEGAGSIPDGMVTVFGLIRLLPKNYKRFFARTFYGSLGRAPPRTISKGFYLEPLKVLAESWPAEPFNVLLRTFFSESVVSASFLRTLNHKEPKKSRSCIQHYQRHLSLSFSGDTCESTQDQESYSISKHMHINKTTLHNWYVSRQIPCMETEYWLLICLLCTRGSYWIVDSK